jgi:hypothetical protein
VPCMSVVPADVPEVGDGRHVVSGGGADRRHGATLGSTHG